MGSKLKLGKIDVKIDISGVSLVLPTDLSIQIETEVDRIVLTSDSLDLTELQTNFLTILKSLPLPPRPSDYGIQVEFKSIDSASLTASGDNAILESALSVGNCKGSSNTCSKMEKSLCHYIWKGNVCRCA